MTIHSIFIKAPCLALVLISTPAFSDVANGLIHIKSQYNVQTTLDKLQSALSKKGMTIFNRISHSDGAVSVGIKINSSELLIFGNPIFGSLLMKCSQTTAIDLPLKALAYKDKQDQVWLAYNDPQYLADRHNIKGCNQTLTTISNALTKFTKLATQ